MGKTIKRKTMFLSITIATIFFILSFTSMVSFQAIRSSQPTTISPLFHLRLDNIVYPEKNPSVDSMYIGKDRPVQIPLPTREILTEDILTQLSNDTFKEQVRLFNSDLWQKWDSILVIAKNNLEELNRLIRQDYNEYYDYLSKFSISSRQEAQNQFIDMLHNLELQDIEQNNQNPTKETSLVNITAGPICNITSGQICQITTQPICQITSQPICSLTKGFFCWTIYGPICPTTGIKCHPPTSRPVLCNIFGAAGKILKTIILVLLLATVIFVPIAILSLVFITMSNPERCEQIHEQITLRFNCTAPE
jgi:hypothetical protein